MNPDVPSKTARKVALNILALGEKPKVSGVLPPGIVDATAALLIASGVASDKAVRWFRSYWMVRLYEACDWMLPGQFDAFAFRKAFYHICPRPPPGICSDSVRLSRPGAGSPSPTSPPVRTAGRMRGRGQPWFYGFSSTAENRGSGVYPPVNWMLFWRHPAGQTPRNWWRDISGAASNALLSLQDRAEQRTSMKRVPQEVAE